MSRRKPWRTESGAIRFNRDFTRIGVGRIVNSSGTSNLQEFYKRDAILGKLADNGQLEALRALKAGRVSIEQFIDADRRGQLRSADLLSGMIIHRNLWEVVTETIPQMGRAPATRRRYAVSFKTLRHKGTAYLGANAKLADLDRVPWGTLQEKWNSSAADWNHLRRAVSSLLTKTLGDKYHPLRRAIMVKFPRTAERPRVPDLSPEKFWGVVRETPEHVQAAYVTLAATGMRVGEYLRCTRFDLREDTFTIRVHGTKTAGSDAVIHVDPQLWPWVRLAIPAPVQHRRLGIYWRRACKVVKVEVRLHDLRHCYAQWAANNGVPEAAIQVALRHSSPDMTRIYTTMRDRGQVANVVGGVILRAAK